MYFLFRQAVDGIYIFLLSLGRSDLIEFIKPFDIASVFFFKESHQAESDAIKIVSAKFFRLVSVIHPVFDRSIVHGIIIRDPHIALYGFAAA